MVALFLQHSHFLMFLALVSDQSIRTETPSAGLHPAMEKQRARPGVCVFRPIPLHHPLTTIRPPVMLTVAAQLNAAVSYFRALRNGDRKQETTTSWS